MTSSKKSPLVLGIDPGFDRVGIAILLWGQSPTLLFSTCIVTSKQDSKSARLTTIRNEVGNIIKTHTPDVVAIESLFFSTNKKTALGVAEARGVLREVTESYNVPMVSISPQETKMAVTGHGRSTKQDIMKMLPHIVHNTPKKALDDEYDAIAIALAGGAKWRSSHIPS